jgi:hypothetical protein
MSTIDLVMLIFLALVLIGGMASLFIFMKD